MTEAPQQCSDPYRLSCNQTATGWMRGQAWSGSGEVEEVIIALCNFCAYWNCDWDWEESPEGPFLT